MLILRIINLISCFFFFFPILLLLLYYYYLNLRRKFLNEGLEALDETLPGKLLCEFDVLRVGLVAARRLLECQRKVLASRLHSELVDDQPPREKLHVVLVPEPHLEGKVLDLVAHALLAAEEQDGHRKVLRAVVRAGELVLGVSTVLLVPEKNAQTLLAPL